MKKKTWHGVAGMLLIFALALTGCSSLQNSTTREAVIADGLAKIMVEGETDLPGNFLLSFVYSRNLIMLDGKGNIVWSKHEEQPVDGAQTGFWDFKKHDVNGRIYYS